MTPLKFAIDTTERSIPPVIIASIIARASNPYSGNWLVIDWKLISVRNFCGRNTEITIIVASIMRKRVKFSEFLIFSFILLSTRKAPFSLHLGLEMGDAYTGDND